MTELVNTSNAFTTDSWWFRGKYEIREVPPMMGQKEPVRCIVALADFQGELYDVLSSRGDIPVKQLERSDSPEQDYAPHVALARLNPWDNSEVLRFVNRWGLLGLWATRGDRYLPGLPAKPTPNGSSYSGSGWYVWDEYVSRRKGIGLPRHFFCEPVGAFALAVKEYQRVLRALDMAEDDDDGSQLNQWISEFAHPTAVFDEERKTWRFGWQCNSLLAWVYLLTFLDKVEGFNLVQCARENCRKLYMRTRPNDVYCSEACRNAQRQARLRQNHPEYEEQRRQKRKQKRAGHPQQ